MEFIKIYKGKVPNATKSLDRKVQVAPILEKIQFWQTREAFSRLLANKELNFWDFGVRASPQISVGDSVRILCGTACYSGQVIAKLEDPSGEVGDLLGWSRQFKAPWRNICALDIYSRSNIDSGEVDALIGNAVKTADSFYSVRATHRLIKREALAEGRVVELTLTKYERNPANRKVCIEHFGTQCQACGFDFGAVYGELGMGFIHVHHITPLSQVREAHTVDPIKDLIPVCPNCHAMLHIQQGDPLSMEQLRAIIDHNKN